MANMTYKGAPLLGHIFSVVLQIKSIYRSFPVVMHAAMVPISKASGPTVMQLIDVFHSVMEGLQHVRGTRRPLTTVIRDGDG
jgi:hypothetical protein